MNTKKTYFINIKTKIETQNSHEPSEYPQSINKPKNVAVYFKDVITEETFSSQDQKLVETINLWRQLFSDKKLPQLKSTSAMIANPVELMNGTTMNTSRWLN